MDALEFYKSHESSPLPGIGDLVTLTVEELCELLEEYHESKIENTDTCKHCGSDAIINFGIAKKCSDCRRMI